MKALLLLTICVLLSGCVGGTISKRIDTLPQGSASLFRATVTGKFSSTSFVAERWNKTEDQVTAGKLHFRHSNIWVPLIEGEAYDYVRDRTKKSE